VSSMRNAPIGDVEAEIAEGLLALDEGKPVPFDGEAVERIKRAGRDRLEAATSKKTT